MNDNQTPAHQKCMGLSPCFEHLDRHYAFTILQLQMLVIFCVTQCLHLLILKPLGFHSIVSQLLAGVLLGRSCLGRIDSLRYMIFPPESEAVANAVAMLGYTFTLFMMAVKMDFTIMTRTGRKACVIGLMALSVSLAAAFVTRLLLGSKDPSTIFGSSYLTVTSFPVVASLLRELGLLNSELGRLAVSAVLSSEIMCVCVMLFNQTFASALGDNKKLLQVLKYTAFLATLIPVVIFVMRPCMRWMIRQTPQGRPVRGYMVRVCFFAMLVGALWTNATGQFVMLGSYIVGAGVLDGPPLGSTIVDKLDTFIAGILEPYLVTTCTMMMDLSDLSNDWLVTKTILVVFVVMFVSKIGVCLFCGVLFKMALSDALALAFILCHKGVMDVASYRWWYDLKNISADCFATLEFCAIIAASICPHAVKLIYDPLNRYAGYQIRDITRCCKPHTDLRIITCIRRPENVAAVSNLIKITSPTVENPTVAFVLHLLNLQGCSQPVFISHDIQKKKDDDNKWSYSDEVVCAFKRFEHKLKDSLFVHAYTAVSPAESMHEDICTLALDKVASLIVLPFHRRYGYEGCLEYDDHEQRVLNSSVLERSPCSVAVLIDRSNRSCWACRLGVGVGSFGGGGGGFKSGVLVEQQVIRVGVVFIGGNDDREALAYSKRMSLGKRIRLDVIRVVAIGNEDNLSPLDLAALEEMQEMMCYREEHRDPVARYVEVKVRDGPELALKLREMVMEYNLMLVGRRYKHHSMEVSGLEEWAEMQELGIVGDLLAAPDLRCSTSVLIVQRQQHWSTLSTSLGHSHETSSCKVTF